eukprot:203232_1
MAVIPFMLYICFKLCQSQCTNNVAVTPKLRDRRFNTQKLDVVTYNVEWLYDDGCPDMDALKKIIHESQFPIWGVTNNEDSSSHNQYNTIKRYMTTHIQRIAGYLDDMNADIYVLEEACDCDTLEKVRDKMSNKLQYRSYLQPNTKGGMQTGIITRIDPTPKVNGQAKIELVGVPNDLQNDRVFQATFDIGDQGKQLVIFGTHLTAGENEIQ